MLKTLRKIFKACSEYRWFHRWIYFERDCKEYRMCRWCDKEQIATRYYSFGYGDNKFLRGWEDYKQTQI